METAMYRLFVTSALVACIAGPAASKNLPTYIKQQECRKLSYNYSSYNKQFIKKYNAEERDQIIAFCATRKVNSYTGR